MAFIFGEKKLKKQNKKNQLINWEEERKKKPQSTNHEGTWYERATLQRAKLFQEQLLITSS